MKDFLQTFLYLPPTVQNWPNRFSEATLNPFDKTVTLVT